MWLEFEVGPASHIFGDWILIIRYQVNVLKFQNFMFLLWAMEAKKYKIIINLNPSCYENKKGEIEEESNPYKE